MQRPTEIFASNDDMAAGCLVVAHEAGIAVTEELSVAGFDDSYLAQRGWPPLTTIRQPIYDIGFTAARQLFALIGGEWSANEITLASTHRTCHHGTANQSSPLMFPTHSTAVVAALRASERFVRIHDSVIRNLNECSVDSVNIDF